MSKISQLLAQAATAAGDLGTFTPPTKAFSEGSDTAKGAAGNLELLLSTTFSALTVLGGIFFIIYFVLAAFSWVSAGGDASKVGKARDKMILAVIGLVFLVMSYGLIGLIGSVVGLDLLRPGRTILNIAPTAPAAAPTVPTNWTLWKNS